MPFNLSPDPVIARSSLGLNQINPLAGVEGVQRMAQAQTQLGLMPITIAQKQADLDQTTLANQQATEKVRQQQEDRQGNMLINQQFADSDTGDWKEIRPIVAGHVSDRVLRQWDSDEQVHQSALLKATQDQRATVTQNSMMLGEAVSSVLEAPLEQRQSVYAAQKKVLTDAGVPLPANLPDQVPDEGTLKAVLGGTLYAKNAAQIAEQKALAQRNAAAAERQASLAQTMNVQQKKEMAAQEYTNVTSPEQHAAWLEKWGNDPDVGDLYKNYQTYAPQNQDRIREQALTANQQMTQTDKQARARIYAQRVATGGPAALAATATDPNNAPEVQKAAKDALDLLQKHNAATPNELGRQQRDAERDQTNLTKLQVQEAGVWGLVRRYEGAAAKAQKDGVDTVKDPKTGRDIPVADAITQAQTLRQNAADLNKGQVEIQKRRQWGDFAPVPAPSATPPPAATAAPPGQVGPKIAKQADVQAYAQKKGVSIQQATKEFTDKGWQISQ